MTQGQESVPHSNIVNPPNAWYKVPIFGRYYYIILALAEIGQISGKFVGKKMKKFLQKGLDINTATY
jgi:hypothetical protein